MMSVSRRPFRWGCTPHPIGHCHLPGESLLCAGACLGLLLCCDTDFYLLISIGFHLLHIWWPLSCKGNFLLDRGSWIAERVSLPCGRKDWLPLHACLGRCAQNTMLVMSLLMLPSGTSLPRHASLVPGPSSSMTSAGHWRNIRSFLPTRDEPGGARGDTSRGARGWPASHRWAGPVSKLDTTRC
jgi:hypothetical protein